MHFHSNENWLCQFHWKILDSHKRKTNKNKTVKIKSSRSSLASVSKINWEYVTGVSES